MGFRFLIVLAIIGFAEYYSFVVVRSLAKGLSVPARNAVVVTYIVVTLISWLGFVLFRKLNWANMPHLLRNMYIGFVVGLFVGKILVLLVMLVDDVRRLFTWVITSFASGNSPSSDTAPTIERSLFLKQVAVTLAGISILGFTYGVRNRYRYQVRKLKLTFANLPEKFRGLKIVQISDIHTGSFDSPHAVEQGIKKIMEQNADLIFFTGDLVNNVSHEVDDTYQKIFSQLKAPLGVYSILGNHDYGDYVEWPSPEAKAANLETLKSIHGKVGWKLMMNENVVLDREGQKIAILGIENWSSKAHFPRYGDLARAHAGLAEQQIPFKMLLSHDPSHWDEQVCTNYTDIDLTFSGHTHGMQFGIDSKIFKWSPVQYMYAKWAGIYQYGKQFLYVNRGFGFLGYPGRLGILPEITLIELA